jgi:hypothetical protein
MEKLLCQLPEDVIGSGLNMEDQERVPTLSLLHSICREGVSPGITARSLWSRGVCRLWISKFWGYHSNEDLRYHLGQDTVAWWVGISMEAAGSYVTLKSWVFSYRTTWYRNPQDHNMVDRFICILIDDAFLVEGSFQQLAMNLAWMLFVNRNLQLYQAPCIAKLC